MYWYNLGDPDLSNIPADGHVYLISDKDGETASKELIPVVRHLSMTRERVDLGITCNGPGVLNLDFLRACPNLVALGLHATRIDLKGIEVCPHMERRDCLSGERSFPRGIP